jgi:hypothetical protein
MDLLTRREQILLLIICGISIYKWYTCSKENIRLTTKLKKTITKLNSMKDTNHE